MLMEKTLQIMKQEAYLRGWQDAADAITSKFEEALRSSIESVEVPSFEDKDDNTQEPQG